MFFFVLLLLLAILLKFLSVTVDVFEIMCIFDIMTCRAKSKTALNIVAEVNGRFPESHFPGKTFPGKSFSRKNGVSLFFVLINFDRVLCELARIILLTGRLSLCSVARPPLIFTLSALSGQVGLPATRGRGRGRTATAAVRRRSRFCVLQLDCSCAPSSERESD